MPRKLDIASTPVKKDILIYGKPGSGKTSLAATAASDPRLAPALVLDVGGNPWAVSHYDKVPSILQLENLRELSQVYDWLHKGQPAKHRVAAWLGVDEDSEPFKTIIIDNLTDLQRMALDFATGNKNKLPGDQLGRTERQHFGQVLGQMIKIAWAFYRELPLNVIMTVQEAAYGEGGAVEHLPLLQGQAGREVPGHASLVIRMIHFTQANPIEQKLAKAAGATNKDVLALTTPNGKYLAKNQYGGKLAPVVVNPHLTDILDAIDSHLI